MSRPDPDNTGPPKPPSAAEGPSGTRLNGSFLRGDGPEPMPPEDEERARLYRKKLLQAHAAHLIPQTQPAFTPPASSLLSERPHTELVLDENNLLPFDFLRTGDRMGRAVVMLRRADGCSGTGFLVDSDILLTNHHVLPTAEVAATTRATANYEIKPPEGAAGVLVDVPLDPASLFVTNADLDFTFCAVHGLEHLGVVSLTRNSLEVLQSEAVNIIQHPRGGFKQVALQDNKVVRADNVVLHYTCDTEPGSSGSPVFNNQWSLVALHHASVPTDSEEGRPSLDADPNARFLNEGIRLSAIAAYLESVDSPTPEVAETLSRLRSIYRGLDPQIGFFGILGRRPRGRTAAEGIIESYRNDDGDLDVGYWDFTGSARAPRDQVHALGRVITDMGLKVWCLEGVREDETHALVRYLAEGYRLDYEAALVPSSARPGLAVLYRKSRITGIERRPWNMPNVGLVQPARLVLRVRGRNGQVRHLGLVPLSADVVPEVIKQLLEILTCEVGHGDPADWLLISRNPMVTKLAATKPAHCPLPTGCAQLRVIGDGHDGAFAFLGGNHSCVRQVFVSPNLAPLASGPHLVEVTRDRALPSLHGVWQDPFAIRLSLNEEPEPAPQSPPCVAPVEPLPPPPPEPGPTIGAPPPPPLASMHQQLEEALHQLLRPVLSRIIEEALRGPSR